MLSNTTLSNQIAKRHFGDRFAEVSKHRIMKEQKKAIYPKRYIHLGMSIKIPKCFKLSKYFLKL